MLKEKSFGPVRFIPGDNFGRYPHCHSVYIEGAGVLIDPASNQQRLASLIQNSEVKAVWLSHYHDDHFLYLDLFKDVPLWMCEEDAPPLRDLEVFLDWGGLDREDTEGFRQHWRDYYVNEFHFQPQIPSNFLVPGTRIDLESVTVEIIHTPGHTPGHLAFYFIEPGVLFLGDYDLTPFGPWYGDSVSSLSQTIESINTLRKIPARTWITSHETGLFEKEPGKLWDQYLGVINDRQEKLLDFLTEPKTMQEIEEASFVYGSPREPKAFFLLGERLTMQKHLQLLMTQSRVIQEGDRFVKI